MTAPQLTFFAILLAAFVLLATERLRNDLVAILIIVALAATGLLAPAQALGGLGSEPAVVLASIFVLSAALHHTGVSDTLGAWIARLAGGGSTRALGIIMAAVGLLSAFTHHVTMTAIMLPTTLQLCRERRIPPSTLLMPLSFAASLGTTITVIGAPAFLIASGLLQQAGRPGLGLFSIAPIGLALVAAGTLYMLTLGRVLLPRRPARPAAADHFRLDQYFTEVTIQPDSPLLDRAVAEVEGDRRFDLRVVGLLRDGQRLRRSLPHARLEEGDVLLVRATPETLVALRRERGVELRPVAQYQPEAAGGAGDEITERLVQAIVAPRSELVGHTLRELDFHRRWGALVVGLWRQQGWLEQELADIRLQAGDVLVLQGEDEALARVAADPGFLMLVPFQGQLRLRRKGPLAAAIMVGTVLAASVGAPLELAALAGAAAMVLSGCLTAGQAYRAVDARIYVFVAGAIPLGTAMKESGAADLLAGWLGAVLGALSPFVVLLGLYAAVALVTEFMSDAATTALLGPVALALAQGLGRPPEPYVVTVAVAAVTAFLTPMAHHGNLVVYGPGGYRFGDFARVGAPLTAAIALIVAALAPLLWPE